MKPTKSSRKPTSSNTYHHGDLYQVLLEAGEQELNEQGIEKFSMRGVAKRAGVSHSAPAHYFANSKALLTALATRGFELFLAMQIERESAYPENNLEKRLFAAGLAYVDFAEKHPGKFRLMFASDQPNSEDPELKKACDDAFNHLIQLVHGNGVNCSDIVNNEQKMQPVIKAWALVHGIANLSIAGQLGPLHNKTKAEKESFIGCLLAGDSAS